jgi:hypothetical protein
MTTGEGVAKATGVDSNGNCQMRVDEVDRKPAIPTRAIDRQRIEIHRNTITPIMIAIQPFFDIDHPVMSFR